MLSYTILIYNAISKNGNKINKNIYSENTVTIYMDILKKCCKCNLEKEKKEFNKQKRNSDGFSSYCKECNRELSKKYYARDPEKRISEIRKWQSQNSAATTQKI